MCGEYLYATSGKHICNTTIPPPPADYVPFDIRTDEHREVEALERIADTLRLIYLMQRKQLAVMLGGAAKGPIDETVLDDLDVDYYEDKTDSK
jgi:hypothetical protein